MSQTESDPAAFAWRTVRESVLLLLLAALAALLVGVFHPRRPAWRLPYPAEIAPAAVRSLPRHILWVDARSQSAYLAAHLHGAVLLNEGQWNALLPAFLERWQPGATVIVYCDSRNCGESFAVARRLQRELRIKNIHTLKGGWAEWLSRAK